MSKYRKQDIETLLRLQLGEAEKAKINAQQAVERLWESRQCAETYMLIIADKLQFSSSQFPQLSSGWCEELVNAIADLQAQLAAAQALADQATRLGNAALADVQSKADLWRDEFRRIKALTTDGEIVGICDRAQQDIEWHVPITVEVEQLQQQVAQLRENAEAATKIYTRLLQSMTDWMARLKPDHHPMYKRGVEEVIASAFNGVNLDSSPVLMSDWQKQQVQFAQLHTAHTTLRGLVEQLPVAGLPAEHSRPDDFIVTKDGEEWLAHTYNYWAKFATEDEAKAYAGLLQYRATLPREGGAQL